MKSLFRKFAQRTSSAAGSSWAFVIAFLVVLSWGLSGPIFGFSDTWQLVINTSTTIVTFLMVFLIQNTQNRDAKALHLKMDELIRAVGGARQEIFVDLEDKDDEELARVKLAIEIECELCTSPEEHARHTARTTTNGITHLRGKRSHHFPSATADK
jgi:low affinity Fe/Cu permease